MRARLDAAAARVRHPRAWLRGAWQGQSLRTKLVVMIAALMLALVAVTALATAALFRQEAVRQLDEDMAANRDTVSMYLANVAQTGEYYMPQLPILRFYGVVWDNEGARVVQTPVMPDADEPALPDITPAEALERGSASFEVPGTQPDSSGWRVQLYGLSSGDGTMAVALPLQSVTSSVERVTSIVVTIGLLATAGTVIVANLAVQRAFRTLNRVERTAAKIAAGDLSQRVESAAPDTEVGRLSRSLNAMLAHIESAFRDKEISEDKMRRFVQDASHELRTPLVTIRGFSELYRHGGLREEEDVAAADEGEGASVEDGGGREAVVRSEDLERGPGGEDLVGGGRGERLAGVVVEELVTGGDVDDRYAGRGSLDEVVGGEGVGVGGQGRRGGSGGVGVEAPGEDDPGRGGSRRAARRPAVRPSLDMGRPACPQATRRPSGGGARGRVLRVLAGRARQSCA